MSGAPIKRAVVLRMFARLATAGFVAGLVLIVSKASAVRAAEPALKAGIIGCDTSHVIAFTRALNAADAGDEYRGVTIAYAYPGGSDDIPASRDRVTGYVDQLRGAGVEIVATIDELVAKADVIFLESVDGRKHLPQFRHAAVGKPVFIDKPIAASLADTLAIFRIAEETRTPCFSSSGLRYAAQVTKLRGPDEKVLGAATASPFQLEPHHPDLFWYGIHGVEALYALMGPGCEEVSRVETDSACVVVGRWRDGRLGEFRGIKSGKKDYTFVVFGQDRVDVGQGFSGYEPLLVEACNFFTSGEPPVTPEETIEIVAFMEAADESLAREGEPVSLAEMIQRAEKALRERDAASQP